jgi:hypothetical protein
MGRAYSKKGPAPSLLPGLVPFAWRMYVERGLTSERSGMEKILTDVGMAIGGGFAIVGAIVGGVLGYPRSCDKPGAELGEILCDSVIWGEVAQGEAAKWTSAGVGLGTVAGALVGLVVAEIWPQAAKDAGVKPPEEW